MPRKPKFIHPLRQIRACLGRTQSSFAKQIGCSAITIQRIENGTLQMSRKLAYSIMEATGADPVILRSGRGKALDMGGREYDRMSYDFYSNILPVDDKEFRYLVLTLSHYTQLMLIAADRGGQRKARNVFCEIQNSFEEIANDLHLKNSIHAYLIEGGYVDKRKYRVSDLRKFPEFARIIGYKDDKRFSPDKIILHNRPKGWIPEYFLDETPVLPPDAEMKLHPNATYILDNERTIPEELKSICDQALYWKINEFRLSLIDPPQKA